MKKALVLLSGGQDSTTCLYWAKSNFDHIEAIGFDYGQKHLKELEQAKKIAKDAKVDFKIIDIKNCFKANHEGNTFASGRNILFLSIAGSYAVEKNINDIVTGVCQTDFSDYPDCRRTSIDAMQNVLSLAYGSGDFRIHTPLMYLTKAETWKMAKDLDCFEIIINDTLTDYNGDQTMNEWGMGVNNNCATDVRMKGYFEAKQKGWI
jgi:7-cyano-7-deazaguanine synthase